MAVAAVLTAPWGVLVAGGALLDPVTVGLGAAVAGYLVLDQALTAVQLLAVGLVVAAGIGATRTAGPTRAVPGP